MFKQQVTTLLNDALEEREDLFLIEFTVGSGNKINVVIDGDNGVTVSDCIDISRAIEHNLDRDEEDFSLEVMSYGAASPLLKSRQYVKNIGRDLQIKLQSSEKLEGTLTQANEEKIVLEWKAREPKPVGKGKVTVQKKEEIAYSDIAEAKVKIKF
ncbi:ribosome assembly cofactor RimP [Pseudofulvibacter geojedonensis]|uniref:Ribosome maturation factor RimP n=1 Tax=Pseudofulvibacter geojedonensis TaxID=1123758 RepID=A0ABW3I1I0_9FLAO